MERITRESIVACVEQLRDPDYILPPEVKWQRGGTLTDHLLYQCEDKEIIYIDEHIEYLIMKVGIGPCQYLIRVFMDFT